MSVSCLCIITWRVHARTCETHLWPKTTEDGWEGGDGDEWFIFLHADISHGLLMLI